MKEYLKYISDDESKSYAIYVLANYCMPTLLKVKPSNMVNVNKKYISNKTEFFERVRQESMQFESSYYILFEDEARCLILIYNKELFHKVFLRKENRKFLDSYGYQWMDDDYEGHLLKRLSKRYEEYKKSGKEFPHEVGILLGYPLKDVRDFIKYSGKQDSFSGVWKVYHDVDQAKRTFELFRRIRNDAIKIILEGKELKEMKVIYPD